jgi:hypothetical protein
MFAVVSQAFRSAARMVIHFVLCQSYLNHQPVVAMKAELISSFCH